jgi:DNA mismatch repair protein MutS
MSLTNEYLEHYDKYVNEYGEKTCVFMQIGSFYEMQKVVLIDGTTVGNLDTICNIIHIQITRRNKKEEINPSENTVYFAGFPKPSIAKYMQILLDNGYTVVLIDEVDRQGNKSTRAVAGVYSPSMHPWHLNTTPKNDENSLTSVLIEVHPPSRIFKTSISYSIINVSTSTNTFDVYENHLQSHGALAEVLKDVVEDISFTVGAYDTSEWIIWLADDYPGIDRDNIKEQLGIHNIHWKQCKEQHSTFSNLHHQNQYLNHVYPHIDFGLLAPVQYFDMERCPLSVAHCLHVLQFMTRHDQKYIQNIAKPVIVGKQDVLALEMGTTQQLNLLGGTTSLFDIINKTKTVLGKRALKRLLARPWKNAKDIISRYALVDAYDTLPEEHIRVIGEMLNGICDIDRLHRKMGLQLLHPYEFHSLHSAYTRVMGILETLNNSQVRFPQELQQIVKQVDTQLRIMMSDYNGKFVINEMNKYSLNEQHINIGMFLLPSASHSINTLHKRVEQIESELESIKAQFQTATGGTSEWFKLSYNENDGYHISCTKIRATLLEKAMSSQSFQIKSNTNACKITTPQMKSLSLNLVIAREAFGKAIREFYIAMLGEFAAKYSDVMSKTTQFIELIDVLASNAKCKQLYNYCRPSIADKEESYVKIESLRHPIIERLRRCTEYVANDVNLGASSQRGMVLYALNSCGKSSLLRSIGLAVVMAQCGLYVPCSSFELSPFHCIISQVDMSDNLWKGQSSFVSEMVGLKKILSVANKNTLVLSDELTKGTEVVSATSIFAASVLRLLEQKCKFVFTTHLQDVAKLKAIKMHEDLNICHLSVEVIDDVIVFERKLKQGPCSELYGLEVARATGLDKTLIESAFQIRNTLVNTSTKIASKTSRYNARKVLFACEVCGYKPCKPTDIPLDTHHINFQCTADSKDFIGHFHKHAKHNLVALCKTCHIAVHDKTLIINGYKTTTNGIKLDYQ